ncbi:MAG TPA: ABC transporter permease [Ktedonobacterales bacterium]|nr:ABC transporter permease [Ktedonobacterales bacterium]
MALPAGVVRNARASYAFFERNIHLTKRYWAWEVVWLVYNIVNAVSVTYIGKTAALVDPNAHVNTSFLILYLLIGTVVWSYLSVAFDQVTETITLERWEGTIEYTFMAPITRLTHLLGSCLFAVVHGLFFVAVQLVVISYFFNLDLSHANVLTAGGILLIGSVSFVGFGIMAAILPLLYTERGAQMAYIVRALILLVSGVYYPISVLPGWMQPIARISPATYVLDGMRQGILYNKSLADLWPDIWPLLIAGVVSIPIGLWIFRIAERYAKRTGKLKRNG